MIADLISVIIKKNVFFSYRYELFVSGLLRMTAFLFACLSYYPMLIRWYVFDAP